MPLVDMRSPVWPHVRANHPAPCADYPRAEPHIRPGSLSEQMHRRAQARRRAVAINANERELHALGIQIHALESRLNELEDHLLVRRESAPVRRYRARARLYPRQTFVR